MSTASEYRSDLLGWTKESLVDRVLELEANEELAHEIAEESSKSLLECTLRQNSDGWLNLRDIGSPERNIGLDYFVDRAVRYLEGAGILKRCPTDSQLVGWDEMEEEY